MTRQTEMTYIPPEMWRDELARAESRVAEARIVLDSVAEGHTIITGESPGVIYYTGPTDAPPFSGWVYRQGGTYGSEGCPTCQRRKVGIDWVIAGGESGQHLRPMAPDWVRSLRDQCAAAGIAFHYKQAGGRTHAAGGRLLDGRTRDEYPVQAHA